MRPTSILACLILRTSLKKSTRGKSVRKWLKYDHTSGSQSFVAQAFKFEFYNGEPWRQQLPQTELQQGQKRRRTSRHPWIKTYRPQSLADVAAHRDIVDTIENRLPHL